MSWQPHFFPKWYIEEPPESIQMLWVEEEEWDHFRRMSLPASEVVNAVTFRVGEGATARGAYSKEASEGNQISRRKPRAEPKLGPQMQFYWRSKRGVCLCHRPRSNTESLEVLTLRGNSGDAELFRQFLPCGRFMFMETGEWSWDYYAVIFLHDCTLFSNLLSSLSETKTYGRVKRKSDFSC